MKPVAIVKPRTRADADMKPDVYMRAEPNEKPCGPERADKAVESDHGMPATGRVKPGRNDATVVRADRGLSGLGIVRPCGPSRPSPPSATNSAPCDSLSTAPRTSRQRFIGQPLVPGGLPSHSITTQKPLSDRHGPARNGPRSGRKNVELSAE
jgi:hypothetical protein